MIKTRHTHLPSHKICVTAARTVAEACRDICISFIMALDSLSRPVATGPAPQADAKPKPTRRARKPRARSRKSQRTDQLLGGIMRTLADHGGRMAGLDVCRVLIDQWPLFDEELGVCQNNQPKARVKIQFISSTVVRAGYLTKSQGFWSLSQAGKDALSRFGGDDMAMGREVSRLGARDRTPAEGSSPIQWQDQA